MHPGVGSLKELSDNELESKIYELNRMYHITSNPEVQNQIVLLLDTYKIEMEERRLSAQKKQSEASDENSLDNLIKVS
jgi:hypothetical protein|tara:strand:+ start:1597 stop:1830 length:234 start_codon:yes stop_codon:yes gene_type:complete